MQSRATEPPRHRLRVWRTTRRGRTLAAVGLLLATVAVAVARLTVPASASTTFTSTFQFVPLTAPVTIRPPDYVPVLSTDFFMQQGEMRRVSDQLGVDMGPGSNPEMDNRLICFDLTNFDPNNPYASEVTRTSAGTNYTSAEYWGVSLLLTAPRTANYRCRIEAQTSDGHANAFTMRVVAGGPAAANAAAGTWISVSNSNEVGAHQWTTSYSCDPSDSTGTCAYIGPQGAVADMFLNPPPADTWTAGSDATNVEASGTFQITSCPSGSKSCRDGEHGSTDYAQLQSWLELDQLNPDGSICVASQQSGYAFNPYPSGEYVITNEVHHFPIRYVVSAPVSQNCGGSRQFKLDLHFRWEVGNPIKLDGGTFSIINSARSTVTTVPNVVRGTDVAAVAAIQAAGLTVVTRNVLAPDWPGTVLSQNSPGGTIEPTGSPVQITVSQGQALVPNVLGLSQASATRAITNAGLTVGRISTLNNCVDPGSVQTQNPSGLVKVAPGTAVNITVSTCVPTGGGGGTTNGGGGGNGGHPVLPK
jgi:hypothetical protein